MKSTEKIPISKLLQQRKDKDLVEAWDDTGLLQGLTQWSIRVSVAHTLQRAYHGMYGHIHEECCNNHY